MLGHRLTHLKKITVKAVSTEYLGPGEKMLLKKNLAMRVHCFLFLS